MLLLRDLRAASYFKWYLFCGWVCSKTFLCVAEFEYYMLVELSVKLSHAGQTGSFLHDVFINLEFGLSIFGLNGTHLYVGLSQIQKTLGTLPITTNLWDGWARLQMSEREQCPLTLLLSELTLGCTQSPKRHWCDSTHSLIQWICFRFYPISNATLMRRWSDVYVTFDLRCLFQLESTGQRATSENSRGGSILESWTPGSVVKKMWVLALEKKQKVMFAIEDNPNAINCLRATSENPRGGPILESWTPGSGKKAENASEFQLQ